MSAYLKIKIMSLGAESAIIRRQRQKWLERARNTKVKPKARDDAYSTASSLHRHRLIGVREECRAANLAYAFLRQRPYCAVEIRCHELPRWDRVWKNVDRFRVDDVREAKQKFEAWFQAATDHLKSAGWDTSSVRLPDSVARKPS